MDDPPVGEVPWEAVEKCRNVNTDDCSRQSPLPAAFSHNNFINDQNSLFASKICSKQDDEIFVTGIEKDLTENTLVNN